MTRAGAAAVFAALCLGATEVRAGFRAASLVLRGSFDAGSAAVPGIGHGLGAGIAARLAFGEERASWEAGASFDVAGYTGSGDSDPLLQLAFLGARRRSLGDPRRSVRPYWKLGAGLGLVGLGASGVTLPLHAGLGFELFAGGDIGLDLAVVERLVVIYGGGNPAADVLNGIGIEVAFRFGR
jgi:hypothetical protein